MSDVWAKKWPLAGFFLFTLALFAWTYPTHFLIADEVAYFGQALGWARGKPAIVSDYPPGTALMAAGLAAGFGPKAVFWSGMGAWLIGMGALARLLSSLDKAVIWALYPALFLPGIVLTRTLMSDLPSFALASVFVLLLIRSADLTAPHYAAFAAGLVAGLGVLFRETNLLWALPFLAGAVFRKQVFWKVLWAGFVLGALPRLAWGWLVSGNPFFVRDSGIGFSADFLAKNLAFYVPALLVLMPGGLYFLAKNKSPLRWETWTTVVFFLGLYGCYGYDAFAKSGFKALVLQGRFLLPLLPFVAWAAAETATPVGRNTQFSICAVALALFIGVQIVGQVHNTDQQRITDALQRLPTAVHFTFTPDESRKYLNSLHGSTQNCLPAEALARAGTPQTRSSYIHLITRSDGADWIKKNKEVEAAFQRYFSGCQTTLVCDLTIRDGTRLRVWRI